MVTKIFITLILLLINLPTLFANQAILTAKVNKSNFAKNEQIIVTVTLKNEVSNKSPNIQLLYQNGFALKKQIKSQQTKVIGNNYQVITNWQYVLTNNLTGIITIPKIILQTKQGKLVTNEIKINIDNKITTDSAISKEIYITNSVIKQNLYLKQSFIYKVTITRFIDIINTEFNPPASDQAIIKEIFKEYSERKIINDREAIVTYYHYLVTPHKAGKITIKAATLNGSYLDNNTAQNYNPFASFNSFSNNYKDFTVSGQKYIIDILPAQYKNQEWIAVKNLELYVTYGNKLNDVITNKKELNIGEPVTITIGIKANNITATELPNLSLGQIDNVKIYQDNPKTDTKYNFNKKTIIASKSITFTLIANQAGLIEIPQLNLTWWNVTKEQKEISKISKVSFLSKANKADITPLINNTTNNATQTVNNNFSYLLYISLFINLLLTGVIILIKHSNFIKSSSSSNLKLKEVKINYYKKLDSCSNAKELHDFIIGYFKKNHQLEIDNLTELSKELEYLLDKQIALKMKVILLEINDILYANKTFNLAIKQELKKILPKLAKQKKSALKKPNNKNDFTLNPF
jgi:hypothetical protein